MRDVAFLAVTESELRAIIADAVAVALQHTQPAQQPPADYKPLRLISRGEALKRLGIAAPTLRKLEKRGILRPVRIGRSVKFRQEDIDKLAAK